MRIRHGIITALLLGLGHAALAAPATLVQSVTYDSETITMRLTKETLRGSNFELWSQNASGDYDVITPVDERSYTGTVDGYPGAVSCGILQDDGQFRGAVYFDRGVTWFTLGTAVVETRALDYGTFSNFQYPSSPTVAAGQAGSSMYGYELGVDVDYDYYNTTGSVAASFEGIEYSVCLVRAIYMRDVLLRPYLGRVIIRATSAHDPYTGLTQGGYLDALRLEWENNHTDTNPDLVAGASPTKIGGGLAWVGVVGTGSGYSVNQCNSSGNFDVVFRHEMGHNWGCGHFVGGSPEGAGLMGGNAPGRFSGCEVYNTLSHRDSRSAGILDDEGTYTAIELPPYASMDIGEFIQTVTPSLTFDVLANDHDANGQALSLYSYDGASANGGTVTQQGQNLVYTAPGAFLGTDYFTYTVTDTAGRTAMGVVIIDVQPNDVLRLYLPLDETSGTAAADVSVFANTATLSGTNFTAASVAGPYANAVNLDGVDDHIAISGLQLSANTVTLTAWVKQGATQNGWAGIIFDRSVNAVGMNTGDAGELRYHWNNGQWGWNSGLTPPADTWTFVALVVESSKATMYMNTGTGFQSAVNTATHAPATFGSTYVGWDPSQSARHFNGAIDDARIYSYSMSQADLQDIYDGGGAESPNPFDGATEVASSVLRWAPGAAATGYDVYVGTSLSAVTSATKASPEFEGTTTAPLYVAALADQTQYFWRIDTVTASATLPGSVWTFTTGTVQPSGNAIMINFDRGGGETFAGGELIGPTASDSTFWNAASYEAGSLSSLIDNAGADTGVDAQWQSANTWGNNDGTADDEHKLSVGYLDDGDGSNGDGKGVLVTLSNIPYDSYKVYGLFATDQNSGGSCGMVNFDVNGSWALSGSASTTAAAWGSITANQTANGTYWTEIDPGVTQGNYWVVETAGATCNITGELRDGANRGCLTGVIIERIGGGGPANNPPVFTADPVIKANATEDMAYTGETLLGSATDADSDPLTFSSIAGPAWLTVAPDGALSGTPDNTDTGLNSWTVQASDGIAAPVSATLEITVDNVNDAPVFSADPINKPDADEGVAYNDTIAGSATDVDAGDSLTYSKVSGPAWLSIATDGALSGTPGTGDVGSSVFTVKVEDAALASDTATLNISVNAASVPLPGVAGSPSPSHRARNVSTTPTLSWTAGSDAVSHNVYFGMDSGNLAFQGNQAGTTFAPGTLSRKTTYYWRIDEVNSAGTTTGSVWQFKTVR